MAQTLPASGLSATAIALGRQPAVLPRTLDMLELSTIQRILLTTDGTVTEVVEIYAGESMRVVKLAQGLVPVERDVKALDLRKGHEVLSRHILLQGKFSGDNFLYAESLIVPDRLDEKVRDGLLRCNQPIGYLIMENRMETFREILVWGSEAAGPLADHFHIDENDSIVFRTYRIFANQHPIMQITEKFPESYFRR
jgi:chorismate-pyruvate lyase